MANPKHPPAGGVRPPSAPVLFLVRTPTAVVGLGLLLAHLLLAPLLFSRTTLGAFEYPKAALLSAVFVLLCAIGLIALLRPRAKSLGTTLAGPWYAVWRRPLLLGVWLCVLSAVVSTITSINPVLSIRGAHESHAGLITVLGYAALFFATRALCRSHADARLLLGACVIAAAVAAAYALVQFAGLDPVPWADLSSVGEYLRPFGTLGHPNYLAAYLAMVFPLAVYFAHRAAERRQWGSYAVLAVVGLVLCAGVLLSVSRAAWLALACAVMVVAVGSAFARQWRAAALGLGLPVVAAGLLLGAALFVHENALLPVVGQRIEHLGDSASRQHIWQAALAIFRDHPLFGSGLDTFQLAFGPKRTVAYWQVEWDLTPARAHNEVLHTLATQGIAGAVALLALLIGLVVAGVRAWRRAAPEARPLVLAVLAGTTAFLVQSGFGFTVVACGGLFVTLAGFLSRFGEARTEPISELAITRCWWAPVALGCAAVLAALVFAHNFAAQDGWLTTAGAAAVLVVVLGGATWAVLTTTFAGAPAQVEVLSSDPRAEPLGLWSLTWRHLVRCGVWVGAAVLLLGIVGRPLEANLTSRQGERLLRTDPRRAAQLLARASLGDPTNELLWSKLGSAAQLGARQARSLGERKELYLLARSALRRAVHLSPRNAYYQANLGQVLSRMAGEGLAELKDAYAAYDRALELDPHNANFYADATNAALRREDRARARSYAARGTALYPDFAPTRAQLGYLALSEGRLAEAEQDLLRAVHGSWHEHLAQRTVALANLTMAYLKMGLYAPAVNAGSQALEKSPHLIDLRCNLGQALELLSRPLEAAEAYRRVLDQVPGHRQARAGLARLLQAGAISADFLRNVNR
ncbi:MAG: O-antigen ligase family protein [Gemmataceae bacterium]|nr:O-antigen ligase family protein [Gemmataceae bacterium]